MQDNSDGLRTKLFHFTDREERCMRRAMRQSLKYMQRYGQGPTNHDLVDFRHYARAPKEDNDNL